MGKRHFGGGFDNPFAYFMEVLGKKSPFGIHFPPLYPRWIFRYGLTQRSYLDDLEQYWIDVHTDYYKPWQTTRIGLDTPEVARIKHLGEVGRQEIDEVARQGGLHLRH